MSPKRKGHGPWNQSPEFLKRTRQYRKVHGLDFKTWLQQSSPQMVWDRRHQVYLYEKLRKITTGETKRLMIFMPPRHSKTETVSVRYSAYMLKRNPKLNIILGSYNQKLANRISRRIRRVIENKAELSNERSAAEEWETTQGGGVRAVGVGGGVTGFGAGLVIIDDPVKGRAHAESEAFRERCWEWFNDDIYTRLEPDASIILIQTRWHDDDLAGRLIKAMDEPGGEKWDMVKLPAFSEGRRDPLKRKKGEALWAERYDEKALKRIEKKLGAYSFAALFQQSPIPATGGLFNRKWFGKDKVVARAPEGLNWKRGYDLAVSTRTSADYTASFRCAFDTQGNLYIADGFRKRIEYPDQRRYVVARMQAEKKTEHGIEKALHGQALIQDLRRLPEVRGVPFKAVKVDADKYTRALAWANMAEEGRVYLVQGSWINDFLDEVCRFTGKGDAHDDQVDAVSLAVGLLKRRGGRSFGC
jgi:predicted phage terminase large subunit-like protein